MAYEAPEPFAWNFCGTCGRGLETAHDGQDERPYCPGCRRFYYRNPVPATCCFVRNAAGDLLFVQRAVEPCKGEWTLPGGYIELGEASEESAARELLEETGLRAIEMHLIGVSIKQSPHSGAVMVLGYCVDVWEGEPRPDTDVADLQFFSREKRPSMPFSVHRDLLHQFDAQHPAQYNL